MDKHFKGFGDSIRQKFLTPVVAAVREYSRLNQLRIEQNQRTLWGKFVVTPMDTATETVLGTAGKGFEILGKPVEIVENVVREGIQQTSESLTGRRIDPTVLAAGALLGGLVFNPSRTATRLGSRGFQPVSRAAGSADDAFRRVQPKRPPLLELAADESLRLNKRTYRIEDLKGRSENRARSIRENEQTGAAPFSFNKDKFTRSKKINMPQNHHIHELELFDNVFSGSSGIERETIRRKLADYRTDEGFMGAHVGNVDRNSIILSHLAHTAPGTGIHQYMDHVGINIKNYQLPANALLEDRIKLGQKIVDDMIDKGVYEQLAIRSAHQTNKRLFRGVENGQLLDPMTKTTSFSGVLHP
jgi:hypothetical protein